MHHRSCGCWAGWLGVLAFLPFFFFSAHAHADETLLITPEAQLQFADHCFESGEYYRAIGEYERFIYFFPHSDKVEDARYKICLSYLKGERYQQAIEAFHELIEEYRDSEYALKCYLGMGEAYLLLKKYDMALSSLQNLITIAPDQELRDEAFHQKGWVYLEMGLWGRAGETFENISPPARERYAIEKLLCELKKKQRLKTKNPTTAGLLAIIPGAGHLYCERKRDAFISFLLNGAMIYAAYEAFDNDLEGLGVVIGLFELGFYSGNIYSAVSSAHKYNRDQRNRYLYYLKEHISVNVSSARPGEDRALLLSYQLRF